MAARQENYYRVLGITPDASQQDVRQAYRRLVRRTHPDVRGGRGNPALFRRIQRAYEVLSRPQERARYDMLMQLGRYAQRPRVHRTSYERLFAGLFAGLRASLQTMPTLVQEVEEELRRAG